MEKIICNLCAGSPEIELYQINLSEQERKHFNRNNSIIQTDICIGKEIEYLIKQGVKTYGCCCGHGIDKPSCLVSMGSKNILEKLGYDLYEYTKKHTENGIMEIDLKTDIQCELRRILKNKKFKYIELNSCEKA